MLTTQIRKPNLYLPQSELQTKTEKTYGPLREKTDYSDKIFDFQFFAFSERPIFSRYFDTKFSLFWRLFAFQNTRMGNMVIKQNWYGNDVDVTNLVLAGKSIVLFKTRARNTDMFI